MRRFKEVGSTVPSLTQIEKKINRHFKVDLRSKDRYRNIIDARKFYAFACFVFGYSGNRAAKHLGFNHATFIHHLRTVMDWRVHEKRWDRYMLTIFGVAPQEEAMTIVEEVEDFDLIERRMAAFAPLIATIPEQKLREVFDMIKMKVKSYDWKYEDKVKLYEGETNISDLVF